MRKRSFFRSIGTAVMAIMLIAHAPVSVLATDTTQTATSAETTADTSASSTTSSTQTSADNTGYVALGNTYVTPSTSAGQTITMILPIVNYNFCPLTNVVVEPMVSNKVTEWPFVMGDLNYTQTIPYMSAYSYYADVNATRADVPFTFTVRDDVLTGFYPLKFHVTFLADGQATGQSETVITAYVYCQGKAGSGRLEDSLSLSKPRIIVTGFETDPAQVDAGETFLLTVHVMNTSETTAVSNVLFDLQASVETTTSGSGSSSATSTTYAAFLPTSGSSSIYENSIGAGQSVDLQLEMSARADLAQKPYVLEVNMTYDAAGKTDYTDKASVSIPVYQKSKYDTGEESITSPLIGIGEEGSLSFSIYNTGKTTLNNVWFRFRDDAVTAEDVYVGTITSGSTGYVDASYTGVAENDGMVHAVIEYEDDAGNVTSTDKDFEITVMDMGFEEDMDYMDAEMDDTSSGRPGWVIPVVVIAIAAVLVVVLFLLRKKRLQKKKAEEEKDLFDEDFPEDESGSDDSKEEKKS